VNVLKVYNQYKIKYSMSMYTRDIPVLAPFQGKLLTFLFPFKGYFLSVAKPVARISRTQVMKWNLIHLVEV